MSNPERGSADESDIPTDCRKDMTTQEWESEATDRWISQEPVLDAPLPDDLRMKLGLLVGDDSVDTLADWVTEIRQFTGGGAISIDDLCHSTGETDHWGEMDGERYHFLCFYDAVILAAVADRPVDIRTVSPGGTIITAEAAGSSDLRVTPEQAVFSFGVTNGVEPPVDGAPSAADVYAAVCPYVRAFPGPAAYTDWAESAPAATVGMPLQGATTVAAALVE